MCVSLGIQPLGKPGIRLSPQPPLRLLLAGEIKPNCPKPPSSSPSHHTHGSGPLPAHRTERMREGGFHMLVGSRSKDLPSAGMYLHLVASQPPPKKCILWRKYAHQSIPQVLEHGLVTCDGAPRLGMCAALSQEAVNRIAVLHYRQKRGCQVLFAYRM